MAGSGVPAFPADAEVFKLYYSVMKKIPWSRKEKGQIFFFEKELFKFTKHNKQKETI